MRAEFKRRMRERILDGAVQAIGRVGLEKLNMQEVGRSAGVSRGTVYRYFRNREALLGELVSREEQRLLAHLAEALAGTRSSADQIEVVMRHATWHVREQPVLRQLIDSDPAFVLRGIRDNFEAIRDTVGELVFPLVKDFAPIKRGVVTGNEFVDWITRMLIGGYLFPGPHPERTSRSVALVLEMLRESDASSSSDT